MAARSGRIRRADPIFTKSSRMSEQAHPGTGLSSWPVFEVRHAFNPEDVAPEMAFEPNEVVLYDARDYQDGKWISAKYGSYIPITEIS